MAAGQGIYSRDPSLGWHIPNPSGVGTVAVIATTQVDPAGVSLTGGFTPTVISTSATTLVKTGAGVLHSVVVNSKGTVASTITIYDAVTATGTPIAVIDSLNLSGTFTFDAAMSTGITVVTTGTIAPNITVLWR